MNVKKNSKINKKNMIISIIAGSIIITTVFGTCIAQDSRNNLQNSDTNLTTLENKKNSNKSDTLNKKSNIESDDKNNNLNNNLKIKKENKSNSDDNVSAFATKSKKVDENNNSDNKENDFSSWNKTCDTKLLITNKDNPVTSEFVSKMQLIDYNGKQINKIMKDDLDKMINNARDQKINLFISSAYRSIDRQKTLFNNSIDRYKKQGYNAKDAETKTAKEIAKPGTSEHHTGFAIDFNGVRDDFCQTKEYNWLINNAHKYGFILRYPKNKTNITSVIYEPWHFRYVGTEFAEKIYNSGLCFEEYIRAYLKSLIYCLS